MEEEIKNEEKQEQLFQAPKAEKEIKLTAQIVIVCFAVFSMFLLVLWKVLTNFGVYSEIMTGIFSIVNFGLTLAGIVWAYLRNKKGSFELWLNVAVFGLTIWQMTYNNLFMF